MRIRDALHVFDYTSDELKEALRPIVSLISKSDKAQKRLSAGTWQDTMLRDNLAALRMASSLISNGCENPNSFSRDDLQKATHALSSMICKTEKAQLKFPLRTSQSTLLRNRLKALRIAERLVKLELEKTEP